MILSYRPHKLLSFFIFSSVFLSVVLMGWFPLFYLPDHLFLLLWKAKVKVTQSCTTLCSPKDYIFHGIPQARIMEWVAIPFFKGSSQPRDRTWVSHIAGRFFTIWARVKKIEPLPVFSNPQAMNGFHIILQVVFKKFYRGHMCPYKA